MTCRSCNAEIFFVPTVTGAKMPLDAVPSEDGTVVIENGYARVLAQDELAAGELRYMPHWATCKEPKKHRRGRQ